MKEKPTDLNSSSKKLLFTKQCHCREKTESKSPKDVKTKNGRIMFWLICTVCDNKKIKFTKEQEGNSVAVETFIRALNNKVYKYMTSISKNAYLDKLDGIANRKDNTNHRTIKRNSIVKPSVYIDFTRNVCEYKIVNSKNISKAVKSWKNSEVINCDEMIYAVAKL